MSKEAHFRSLGEKLVEESREILRHIPPGQPILVGHHSEKRHRAAIAKANKKMTKAVDAFNRADREARKCESTSIMSDDSEAVALLRQKLEKLEAKREAIKAHNRQAKKKAPLFEQPTKDEKYPGYVLKNLGANIRSVQKRIEEVESVNDSEDLDFEFDEFHVYTDRDDGRIRIQFDGKPDIEVRTLLKKYSFKWSPSNGVWQRKITANAMSATQRLVALLREHYENI